MKLRNAFTRLTAPQLPELVQSFGSAELLRHPDGHWELRGGSPADRGAAREWISLFCHEAVLGRPPAVARTGTPPVRFCCQRGAPTRN